MYTLGTLVFVFTIFLLIIIILLAFINSDLNDLKEKIDKEIKQTERIEMYCSSTNKLSSYTLQKLTSKPKGEE